MARGLTLQVPAESQFRGLAAEVAARYVESIGGTAADAAALTGAVGETVEAVSSAGDDIDVAFDQVAAGVDVSIRCGGELRQVHQAVSVAKR